MNRRVELQGILEDILGSRNVYFQPPESFKLKYPCVIYRLDDVDTRKADDTLYLKKNRYQLMVIDKNPESTIHEELLTLPLCSFDRFYVSDNLNHYVLTLFY